MGDMAYRHLGDSDLVVSAIGMGCNNFSRPKTATATQEGSTAVIRAAVEEGITFFDGADIYGAEPGRSETFMGVALDGLRDDVVLATKFGHESYSVAGSADWGPKGARRYVRNAVDASLQRLRTDRIDLLQMHTPDPSTPIGDTLSALTELVTEGKVRYLGHSNFSAEQAREADRVAREHGYARFISTQNEYNLMHRDVEADVMPTANELGLGVFPYFPLANGLLTGKYTREGGSGRLRDIKPELLDDVDWDRLARYEQVCRSAGFSMLHVTMGWLLSRLGIASVIAGATTVEQVRQNAGTSGPLSPEVLAAVEDIFPGPMAAGEGRQ